MKQIISGILIAGIVIGLIELIAFERKKEGRMEGYDQALHDCINGTYTADTTITYKPIEK
jgi:hypothetical protein